MATGCWSLPVIRAADQGWRSDEAGTGVRCEAFGRPGSVAPTVAPKREYDGGLWSTKLWTRAGPGGDAVPVSSGTCVGGGMTTMMRGLVLSLGD